MRVIKLLGVVVVFYSLSYGLNAHLQLYSLFRHPRSTPLIKYIVINLTISVVTFVIGIGLLLVKEWARIAWLVTTIMLLVDHLAFLVYFYVVGEDLTQQLINVVFIILLTLISWMNLRQDYKISHD